MIFFPSAALIRDSEKKYFNGKITKSDADHSITLTWCYILSKLIDKFYTPSQSTRSGFSPSQSTRSGFSPSQSTRSGFSPSQATCFGFSPSQSTRSGFSP